MSQGYVQPETVSVEDLWAFCIEVLHKVGVGDKDARTTAEVLVTTDTWGVFTHGVKLLTGYIRRIRAGGIRADARPRFAAEGPGWTLVDGWSGLGMSSGNGGSEPSSRGLCCRRMCG